MQILTQQVWGQAGDSVCLTGSLGVQPQHGPIATETRMSSYCSFKSAPPPPSSPGICHAPGHTSDTWPDPRLPVIFFFLCGKYICQCLVQQKQIFIFEHLLCMLGSLQGPVDTVEAWSQGLLWEPSGMCQPPQVILAGDFSKKTSVSQLVLLERKPFQKFCIHCSFSNAFISPPFSFACQMHRELPDSSTKKLIKL